MTYTVTLNADTRDALAGKIAALAAEWEIDKTDAKPTPTKPQAHPNIGTEDEQPELPIEDTPKAKPKPKPRKKAPAKPKAEPKPEPEPEPTPEPEPQPEPETDVSTPEPEPATVTVSAEALRDQLMAFAQDNGNTKARQLVAEWGKVSDVPEEHRNRIYQEAGGEL